MSKYNVHRIRFLEYHPKSINSIAYDSVGKQLALSREDGSIEILDRTNNWSTVLILPGQDGRSVESLLWCKGRLFSGGLSGELIEWNLARVSPKGSYDSYGGPIWCLSSNKVNDCVAVGCEDGSVRLFEVLTDSLMYMRSLDKQEGRILSLDWSYDGKIIVTGGADGTMRLYNVSTGHVTSRIKLEGTHRKKTLVWSVHFLSDMTIASGDSLGTVQIWDAKTATQTQVFRSHLADVLSLCVSSDEQFMYATGIDSKVVKFGITNSGPEGKKWVSMKNVRATNYDTRSLAYLGDEPQCLVSGGVDPRLVIYPLDDFSSKTFLRFPCLPPERVCSLAANSNRLAYREQHKVDIWSVDTKEPLKVAEINTKGKDHLICVAMSRCGSYVAYSTVQRSCVLSLSIKEGVTMLEKVKLPSTEPCYTILFTNDSKHIIMATLQGSLLMYEVSQKENISVTFELPTNTEVTLPWCHMVISPDDRYLAIVDRAGSGHVFDISSKEYVAPLPRVQSRVCHITFKPDSDSVFMLCTDRKMYEFEISEEKLLPWCLSVNEAQIISDSIEYLNDPITKVMFNPKKPDELFYHSKEVLGKLKYNTNVSAYKKKSKKRKHEDNSPLKTLGRFTNIMFMDFNTAGDLVVVERLISDILAKLPPALYVKKFGS